MTTPLTTSKRSLAVVAQDLFPAGPTTPAAWYAWPISSQTVQCSDGLFVIAGVSNSGVLTLQPVTS